jgi:FSR family fosmidomycin resistance protein-like MFS transporter
MNSQSITLPPPGSVTLETSPSRSHPVPATQEPLSLRMSILVTCLGHALCHGAELLFPGVMLAVMAEFTLNPAEAGALALPCYLLMGLGAFPVGLWCDRWGPIPVLSVYFLAVTIACVLVACSVNATTLLIALIVLGLAISIYHPVGLALLSLHKEVRGRALGIHGVAGSAGITLGPVLGLWAAGHHMWRVAYWILAGIALLAGLLLLVTSRLRGSARAAPPARPVIPPDASTNAPAQDSSWSLRRHLPLMILLLAMMVGGFNYRCLMTALPTFLSGAHAEGARLAKGGIPVGIALAAGALGQLFSGWASDHFGSRWVYLAVMILLIPLALLLSQLGGTLWAVPVACLVAICLFGQQPAENSLLAECTRVGRRGVSYAAKFTLGFGIGALGIYVTGLIWEHSQSLAPVFLLLALGASVMVLCWFLAMSLRTSEEEERNHQGQQEHKEDKERR